VGPSSTSQVRKRNGAIRGRRIGSTCANIFIHPMIRTFSRLFEHGGIIRSFDRGRAEDVSGV